MEKQTLEFNKDGINIVLLGLQKLPWETSNALIQDIIKQLQSKELNKPKEDK